MNFLPAIPLSTIPSYYGSGGMAMNVDGTLLATVDSYQHCVRIYSVIDQTAAPFIVGTAGTAGCLHGQFRNPISACFALRSVCAWAVGKRAYAYLVSVSMQTVCLSRWAVVRVSMQPLREVSHVFFVRLYEQGRWPPPHV